MSTPDMDVIKDIPGYRVILKAVLKSQIQQLVEQLATLTDEESVILTASVADGTLCHLGSDSGKVFLEDHEDFKSQFLGFCLKRHHKKQLEKERQEAQEREEALARSMQAVTPPRYGNLGPRQDFMLQRSPRYPSPRQQGVHPVALAHSPGGPERSPAQRHQPYPPVRPTRQSQKQNQDSTLHNLTPAKLKNNIDMQVIKIEPDDSSNHSANDSNDVQTATRSSVQSSSQPTSPSGKTTTTAESQGPRVSDNDDAASNTSSSAIPDEALDIAGPPGGLSLDSDLSSLVNEAPGSDSSFKTRTQTKASNIEALTNTGLDPDVSVKLEEADPEMDLEITGVELGHGAPQGEQEWLGTMDVMHGASGSSADVGADQQSFSQGRKATILTPERFACHWCSRVFTRRDNLQAHIKAVHLGVRPYQCSYCYHFFARKYNLRNHMLGHMQSEGQQQNPKKNNSRNDGI